MRGLLSTIAVAGSSVLLKGLGVLRKRRDLGRERRYVLIEDEDMRPKTLLYHDDGVDSSYSGHLSFPLPHSSLYTRRHHGHAAMSLPSSDTTGSILGRTFCIDILGFRS